jgi:spore maturation protein CgeB
MESVKFFCEHVDERVKMGQNGRRLLMQRYTVAHSYEIIMNHFI